MSIFMILAALSMHPDVYQQQASGCPDGWRGMGTAPRDGTPVELRNDFGIMPTFSLDVWTDQVPNSEGTMTMKFESPVWVTVAPKEYAHGFYEDEHALCWRPYSGAPAAYIDPTHGAQLTGRYWRRGLRNGR